MSTGVAGAVVDHGAWQDRLRLIVGPEGYQLYMRRSLQTIILYEAKRIIRPRLSHLRPFQKRALLLEQVYMLLDAIPLDFLEPQQKEQILWRTQKDGKQLDDVTAWKRTKIIERDLAKTLKDFKPFTAHGRTHQESVNMFVLAAYVSAEFSKSETKTQPTYSRKRLRFTTVFRRTKQRVSTALTLLTLRPVHAHTRNRKM